MLPPINQSVSRPRTQQRIAFWLGVVALLLAGAGLRWFYLAPMSRFLLYDEAFFGVQAFSIVQNPYFIPFFPENFGNESLWAYVLLPFLQTLGPQPFTLRAAATLTSIITLAVAYRLALVLFDRRTAVWALAALAVLYWHVHFSYLAFRSILLPVVGGMAFIFLLRASRPKHWLYCGLCFGLLGYVYFPSTLWIMLGAGVLAWWSIGQPAKRAGALWALGLMTLLLLPMVVYVLTEPHFALKRVSDVAVNSAQDVLNNVHEWLAAWLYQSSAQVLLNAPSRPILDFPLALLCAAGLWGLRQKSFGARWVFALGVLALLPSLGGKGGANTIRAMGLVLSIACVAGVGAFYIEKRLKTRVRYAALLPAVLFVWAGFNTLRDFAPVPDLLAQASTLERIVYNAVDTTLSLPASQPVYFVPLPYCYPLLGFRAQQLAGRRWAAFEPNARLLLPENGSAYYIAFTPLDDSLWRAWGTLEKVPSGDSSFDLYLFTVGDTGQPIWDEALDALRYQVVSVPPLVYAGETAQITLALQILQNGHSVRIGVDTASTYYNGSALLSLAEERLCYGAAPPVWQPDEVIIRQFSLYFAPEIPPSQYDLLLFINEIPVKFGEIHIVRP